MKLKISFWLLGLLAVLIGLTLWLVPVFACRYVNDNGKQLIGRRISLDDISLNLFTGRVGVDTLCIYEEDDVTPFVRLDHVGAELSMLKLLTGLVDIEHLDFERLYLHVVQDGDRFNFSSILDFFDSGVEEEQPADTTGLPVVLENINLTRSFVRYQDRQVGSDFKINDFSLHIPGIDLRDLNTAVGLSLNFMEGGSLTTGITYDDAKGDFCVNLKLKGFNLKSILPYVMQSVNVSDLQGSLDADMKVKGNLNHILALEVTGQSDVSGFSMTDGQGEPFFKADSMSLGTTEVNLLANRYGFSHIVLTHPEVYYSVDADSVDNITRMLTTAIIDQQDDINQEDDNNQEDDKGANGEETIGEEPLQLSVDHLLVKGGIVHYLDQTLTYEPFSYDVKGVLFEANEFDLDKVNNIRISAAPGSGKGKINVSYRGRLDDITNMNLKLNVQNVELKDFSPYVVQMFGNPMTAGTLSFESATDIQNSELVSSNHLLLNQPTIEKKRKDVKPEMNLPLRTGIYILTDVNGQCDMDIPVSGNVNDPKFSYKRLIFRTLGKLLVKVTTSPFRNRNLSIPTDSLGVALVDSLQFENTSLDDIDIDGFANDSIGSMLLMDE